MDKKTSKLLEITFLVEPRTQGGGGGGTRSTHDGGSDVFFWVENLQARYFFGSRDLSCIFLGLKKYAYFFGSYLRANFSFRVFVVCKC